MKYNAFLGYKNRKLVTIILSKAEEEEAAIDCDRYVKVDEAVHVKKNLEQWLKDLE